MLKILSVSSWSIVVVACLAGCAEPAAVISHDVIVRGGNVYDGSGQPPRIADVAIDADRVVAIGDLSDRQAAEEVDATGLAVAPGFINMLSWATASLIEDGRAQSDIRQGVTLEVFGEGWSMGPINETMRVEMVKQQGDIRFDVTWTTLAEYLDHLVERGIAPNVASFVGATTARIYVIGYEDRPPTDEELDAMRDIVRQAMEEGALGVGSSLIYAPAFYASTDELTALAAVAAEYDGMYISHMRSEGGRLLEAVDELISIARDAGIRAEIYHLKAAGRSNHDKLQAVIDRVEAARAEGLAITADMYTYTAGATGLDAAMPPWVQEGGHNAWEARLADPKIRKKVVREMTQPAEDWENLFYESGPEGMILAGFKNDDLKPLTGKTLAEVAEMRGTSPAETAIDLVIEDGSRVGTIYFMMSEDNVRTKVKLPWVSFGSDAGAPSTEGVFLKSNPHPRAYGTFARVLGRYVRDEGLLPLEQAIHKMTSLPAENLKIRDRGALREGYYADLAIFDPAAVTDPATFEDPHQYATGMRHVFVNGERVLADGKPTGATPGRVVRGPGWAESL